MIARLDIIAREFINHINSRRSINTSKGDPMKGRMYYANEALQMGLIDGVGSMEQMLGISREELNQTSNTNTNMKLPEKIAAFFGAKTAVISDEDISACNTQLASDKAGVFVVAATDEIPDHAALQMGMDASGTEIDRLSAELATATTSLNTVTTARDSAVADAKAKGDRIASLVGIFGDAAEAEGFDLEAALQTAVGDAKKYHGNPQGDGAEGTEAASIPDVNAGDGSVNIDELEHNKRADAMGLA